MFNWKTLQNGSDLRGVALEGIATEPINLTSQRATILGKALGRWLKHQTKKEGLQVALSRDSRLSGTQLLQDFGSGLLEEGVQVYDCGLGTTPSMFMCTVEDTNPMDAGVIITASHLPFNRNGFKFFTKDGGFDKKQIEELLVLASQLEESKSKDALENMEQPRESCAHVKMKELNYMARYAAYLVDYIRREVHATDYNHPLKGLHIVVDAGNGAGGFFAHEVLDQLGAETTGSQFLDPDGSFPNHIPNPENKEAMRSICDCVLKNNADYGIIFDTDVDRSALVDHEGKALNRNTLIALIGAVVLKEHPGSTLVTDSVTSTQLSSFIQNLGGIHHRFKRGYKNVINEGIRLNKAGTPCYLAIETSGHAALKENYFLDDGAFLVAKLLCRAATLLQEGKTLHSLIKGLEEPKESIEKRFKIEEPNFKDYGTQVLDYIKSKVQDEALWSLEEPNYEGVRINCHAEKEQGWFLLRLSLHDPVLPLNIESQQTGGCQAIFEHLMTLLKAFPSLKG